MLLRGADSGRLQGELGCQRTDRRVYVIDAKRYVRQRIDAEWSWLSGNLSVEGVALVGPRGLKKFVQKPGPVDARTRQQIYVHLAQQLPSMT